MPRYFFNVMHDGLKPDFDGLELPSKNAAWEEATTAAGEIIKGLDGALRPGHDWKMEVTDEFANPLWEIRVSAEKK